MLKTISRKMREAVREEVENTSIRKVALAIGVSRGAIVSLLENRKPHADTTAKVHAWYVKKRGPDSTWISPSDKDMALNVLAQFVLQHPKGNYDRVISILKGELGVKVRKLGPRI
jgi:hypothetical protein